MFRCYVLRLTFVALVLTGCEKVTAPSSLQVVAYQVPRCNHSLGKGAQSDSCFSYQFHDALVLDFCASANCCPDSARFAIGNAISNDTIVVTYADTAGQLCRCNCVYVLHVEFHGLPKDSYQVVCRREDYSSQIVFYSERVVRN
jgi:hypothetical protein